jgi:transposase
MGRAYSDDLRRKLLEAHAAGKGTLRELAERFGVSVPWAWKVSAAHKRSGAVERAPQSRHGRPSRVDRAQVRALLKAKPDLVLRELREELERTTGVAVSHTQMWRVVRELGLHLKKSRSMPPSETPKRTAGGAKSSSTGSARSRRSS